MMDVQEYVREDASCPYRIWFDSLNADVAVIATKAKIKMSLGNQGNIKPLDGGLSEYVIDFGPGYRIYLTIDGKNLIILFGGGDKSSQTRDIVRARELLIEYRDRKAAQKQAVKARPKRSAKKR